MNVRSKIVKYADLEEIGSWLHANGFFIVFTSGVYDNLHSGHVKHLQFCKELLGQACCLVVGILDDKTTRRTKGPHRPHFKQKFRARCMAKVDFVDLVVINEEFRDNGADYGELVHLLKPNVWVSPHDSPYLEARNTVCQREGIVLVGCDRDSPLDQPGISTTLLLELQHNDSYQF